MLQLNDYSVAYGQSTIIDGMNLTLKENEIIAILGRNGMGKTTLMKSLIGMIPSKGGTVKLADKELSPLKSHERVSAGLAFVPQGRMIFSTMTVEENIETGLTSTGERNIPSDLYSIFPVLDEMKHRRGGNLSGGQQQRLCIARTLAVKPEIVLMDEPASSLDPIATQKIEDLIWELKERYTIVIVTHNMQQAARISDYTAFLYMGELVEYGPTETIFTNPREERTEAYVTGRFG